MKQDQKHKLISKTTPPASGMVRAFSNLTPLKRTAGMINLSCQTCGIDFYRPAAWAKRAANHYCSRGCSAESRKVRVETHCAICGKSFYKIPSAIALAKTCSKKCSSILRRSDNPRPRNFVDYKALAKKISAVGVCCKCGKTDGPWAVRGIKADFLEDGTLDIDVSNADLWCNRCHLINVAPNALAQADAACGVSPGAMGSAAG